MAAVAAAQEQRKSGAVWTTVKPFLNGGLAGMGATCVIQPVEAGADPARARNCIPSNAEYAQGARCWCILQWSFSWTSSTSYIHHCQLGSFRVLTGKAVSANDGKPLPLYQKALCGLTAGAIGASVGSPADLALIRMQADATLPLAQRRNYKNAFHALYRITKDEGILALWKGAGPTVTRAMALNMGMLASYDQSAEYLRDFGFGEIPSDLGASAVSGFFASACSLPFDYVKTQIQKMQPGPDGKYPYTGSIDCALQTLKNHGPYEVL